MIPLRWVAIDRKAYPPPRRRAERFPLERLTILAMLDDETLYEPSAAAEVGYVKGSLEYIRTRRAFSFFANENGFEEAYDNVERDSGQIRAWYGSSWKWACGGRMHRVADLMDELAKRQRENPGVRFYLDHETILAEKDLPPAVECKHEIIPKWEPKPEPPTTEPTAAPELTEPQEENMDVKRHTRSWYGLVIFLLLLIICGLVVWYRPKDLPVEEPPEEKGPSMPSSVEFMGPAE